MEELNTVTQPNCALAKGGVELLQLFTLLGVPSTTAKPMHPSNTRTPTFDPHALKMEARDDVGKQLVQEAQIAGLKNCRLLMGAILRGNTIAKKIVGKALEYGAECREQLHAFIEILQDRPENAAVQLPPSLEQAHNLLKQQEERIWQLESYLDEPPPQPPQRNKAHTCSFCGCGSNKLFARPKSAMTYLETENEKERKGNISERAGRQGSVLSSRRSVKDPTPTTFKLLKEAAIENGDIYTNGNGSAFRRSWSERHRNGVLQASREHENGDSSLPPNLDREIDPSQNILHPDITNSLNDSIQDNKKTPGSCWRNLHKELSDGQDSSSATVLQSPPNSSLVLPEEFSEQPNATSPCGANPTVYLFPTTPTFQPSDDFTSPNSKAARKFVAWREGDSGSFEMTPNSSPGAGSPLLWVFHDNPQLSTQLQGLLMSERQLQVSALLEVRMPEGRTKLVLGDISFAGDLENAPHSRVKRCPRGGQCMEMSRLLSWELLLAKKGDTNNEAPTRDRDEITDILLSAETAKLLVRGRSHQTPGSTNTLETVESCFRNTQAKIDVMLHPTRDGNWFPYWESKRRLAPQFRSSGIGYLRLADDTGQHGLSFLSVDGGRSFLSNHGFHHQTNLALAEPQLHDQISPRRKSFALDAEADLATKLARLTDRAVASQERVRLVLELEDCLARLVLENDSKENQACSAVFKALQVCLSELSPNAHMVKASCKCLLGIVHLMDAGTLQTHETWPALADSLIHLLKSSNKVIATEISSLLGSLHSNGHLRLGSMATILANQLGVDADECGEATPKKKSVPPSVVQILQWCLTCLNKEFEEDSMKMEDIASYAKIYLSLCDHRQANVRKVATEGLSTIVLQYSIKEGLVFEGDQCPEISIVSGLKQTNPKLYLQLESFIKSQKANQKS